MLNQEQIEKLIEDSLPSIVNGFKDEIKSSISYEVKSQGAKMVSAAVTDWMEKNIIPEINTALVESKDGLLALAPKFAEAMSEELIKGFIAALQEKLGRSYERKKIFQAMFD